MCVFNNFVHLFSPHRVFVFPFVCFRLHLCVFNWVVPSHAIKVVKGNFVHVQPQTPVCKLAFQNYALHTSFYEFLFVVPLPPLFPCPSSACRHSRLWTGLTLAVIGSDTSSCQLVLRVTRVAEILLIGSGFKQSVCSFVFGAICRHDLHRPPQLQLRSLLPSSDKILTRSLRLFRWCFSAALFRVTWYLGLRIKH